MILELNYKTKYLKNIRDSKSGFTILEVIVVMFIITVGLIGILALAEQSIKISGINKNELIASQLAQEGLELVRNVRDKNWLDGISWKDGIIGDLTYIIDYDGKGSINDAIDDINNVGAKLKINGGFYEHSSGIDTIFYRLITVVDKGDYVELECKVEWQGRGQTYNYIASTILYDWR